MFYFSEKKFVKEITDQIQDDILKLRIKYLLNWYFKKARLSRLFYYTCTIIIIVFPVLSTFFSRMSEVQILNISSKNWIAIFSSLSSILASLLVLTRCQESWIRYRENCEIIKSKCTLYLIDRECINSLEDNVKEIVKYYLDCNFIREIEKITCEELNDWSNLKKSDLNNSQK